MPVKLPGSLLAFAALLLASASPAAAESIADALAKAYESNPTLRGERARQRGTDEQIPQALSGWRPTIESQGTIGYNYRDTDGATGLFSSNAEVETNPADIEIALSQPLFRGFRTVEGTKQAEATVRAGNQNLLAVEQQVLFNTAQAYMDVVRDRRIVELRKRNVSVLQEQLRASQARFDVGEVTRTDVAQARARVSFAQATLANARAQLAASSATYVKLVGHAPGNLKQPKTTKLPKSLKEALSIAEQQNPNILSAAFVEDAALHQVEVVKGDLLPELSLQARASQTWNDLSGGKDANNSETQNVSIQGVLNVPLYEAGRTYSAVRQQKQVASQRRIEVIETTRSVREAVVQSWAALGAARETITSARSQVSASALALDGVKQEYLVGSRTTLDVLNAESELTDAQVNLVNAERDQIVAAYQVVGSIGRLTARNLKLDVRHYDSHANERAVRKKWIGLEADTVE
jgi:outer membrane protein